MAVGLYEAGIYVKPCGVDDLGAFAGKVCPDGLDLSVFDQDVAVYDVLTDCRMDAAVFKKNEMKKTPFILARRRGLPAAAGR